MKIKLKNFDKFINEAHLLNYPENFNYLSKIIFKEL